MSMRGDSRNRLNAPALPFILESRLFGRFLQIPDDLDKWQVPEIPENIGREEVWISESTID
jgi:hypothetical protein